MKSGEHPHGFSLPAPLPSENFYQSRTVKNEIYRCVCIVHGAGRFAASCQDMQDAVGGAVRERNGRVSDTHDVLMPDPETERDALSGCLGSVNAIGDAFSLGVTLPSMDQIVAGMCGQVNSYINRKINEAHTQVNNSVNGMGGNNPFKVYGTGGEYVVKITGKLK